MAHLSGLGLSHSIGSSLRQNREGKEREKEERRAGKGEGREQEGGGDGGEARYGERRCVAAVAACGARGEVRRSGETG